MIPEKLKTVIPVRFDKKTIARVKKLSKEIQIPFSTLIRVLVLEALRLRDKGDL